MKHFKYKAKKSASETVEGVVVAETTDDVIDQVNKMGLLPVEINEVHRNAKSQTSQGISIISRVSVNEKIIFYSQLAKLLSAGVPILRGLQIIQEQNRNSFFRNVLWRIHENVKEGNSLSASFSGYSKIFPAFDIAMIQTGESVGMLSESLLRLVRYLEERETLHSKARAALAYPIFITFMGFLTVFIMLVFVIPKFTQFFSDLGQELPFLTRMLIALSHYCQRLWFWVILILCGATIARYQIQRSKSDKKKLDAFLLNLPVIGGFIIKFEVGKLSRSLELLIKNGMQVLNALKVAIPVVGNEAMKEELELCCKKLEEGGRFSEGLKNSRFFPPFFSYLISVGEESGKLDETLREAAEWYEKDTALSVQIFTNLLEPAIILVVGSVLGVIIVAVLLPVFSINALIQ